MQNKPLGLQGCEAYHTVNVRSGPPSRYCSASRRVIPLMQSCLTKSTGCTTHAHVKGSFAVRIRYGSETHALQKSVLTKDANEEAQDPYSVPAEHTCMSSDHSYDDARTSSAQGSYAAGNEGKLRMSDEMSLIPTGGHSRTHPWPPCRVTLHPVTKIQAAMQEVKEM